MRYIKAPVYLQLSDFLFSGGLHRVSWTETQMDYNTTSNKGQGKNVQYIVGQYGPLRLPNRYVIVRFHAFLPLNSFSSLETINQVDILSKQTIRNFPTLYKFKKKT